jgi:F-type H+-transporting ATPase subunit b
MSRAGSFSRILIAGGAAFYALPLQAAEAGGSEGGLPQFNTAFFPEQLFWLAITFSLLYVLMAYVALPRVRKTQDNRAESIDDDLATAAAANEAARAMMEQYEKALADARAKAQATVGEIAAKAAKESAEKQAAQQVELNKRLAEAEAKIAATRDKAIAEVKGSAAMLAASIVEKVTGARG